MRSGKLMVTFFGGMALVGAWVWLGPGATSGTSSPKVLVEKQVTTQPQTMDAIDPSAPPETLTDELVSGEFGRLIGVLPGQSGIGMLCGVPADKWRPMVQAWLRRFPQWQRLRMGQELAVVLELPAGAKPTASFAEGALLTTRCGAVYERRDRRWQLQPKGRPHWSRCGTYPTFALEDYRGEVWCKPASVSGTLAEPRMGASPSDKMPTVPLADVKAEALRFLGLADGPSHIRVVAGLTAEEAREQYAEKTSADAQAGTVAIGRVGGKLNVRRDADGRLDVSFDEHGTYITTWDGVSYLATADGTCRYFPAGCEAQTSRPIAMFVQTVR